MERDRIQNQHGQYIKNLFARAGAWFLLLLGLLAVCVSLPMFALSL